MSASVENGRRFVQVSGHDDVLVELLRTPLQKALAPLRSFYSVRIDAVGRVGEVLVSVTGSKGRVPLLFGSEDLEPGYVSRVVKDTVARFGL